MAPAVHIPKGLQEYLDLPEDVLKDAGKGIAAPVDALSNTTDFLTRLTEPNTWIRVGEFFVGIVLVYVGLKAAFPSTVAAVTSVPKNAAKAGALAA
jgi:hypothetical protein